MLTQAAALQTNGRHAAIHLRKLRFNAGMSRLHKQMQCPHALAGPLVWQASPAGYTHNDVACMAWALVAVTPAEAQNKTDVNTM